MDMPARRVDVERDFLVRIFGFEEQQLGADQARQLSLTGPMTKMIRSFSRRE